MRELPFTFLTIRDYWNRGSCSAPLRGGALRCASRQRGCHPARPGAPQPPDGSLLEAGQVAGSWLGTLALYPAELGMAPVPFQLTLETRAARPSGRVRILFPQGTPLEAEVVPRVEGGVLSFSLHDAALLEATLHFRAVLEAGGLRGVANAVDAQGGRWFGSWSAHSALAPRSTDPGR